MRVLLVESNTASGSAGTFKRLGHELLLADGLAAAVELFDTQRPELVVVDDAIPDGDAHILADELLKRAAPRWQPIFLISDNVVPDTVVRALEYGIDAVFPKPVLLAALTRRLEIVERQLVSRRDAEARMAQLGRYLAAEKEDLGIARHLIEHQLAADNPRRIDDPAIQYWHQSCPGLGGDMLAHGRAPNGVLHAMLADARGGGLAACVSLLPIIAPFHRMTEKGFPLTTIVRELNLKLRQVLPENRAVAALLVAIDPREGIVTLWNGGMPSACMLDGFGHRFQDFSLRHAALGAVDDACFDDSVEQHAFARGEQLVLMSDGLAAAMGPDGRPFGVQGLRAALIGLPRSQRLVEATAALRAHIGERALADDISLVLIDCEKEAASAAVLASRSAQTRHPGNWRFSLCLGAHELAHLDVVPLLLNVTGQFDSTRERGGELFVILSELFNNALDHGVLRLDSRLKLSPDGMEAWLRVREERLSILAEGEIKLSVEQMVEDGRVWLRIRCRDSGPGFDVAEALRRADSPMSGEIPGVISGMLPFGRGLALVRHMAKAVDFNDSGNEATVLLSFDDASPPPC